MAKTQFIGAVDTAIKALLAEFAVFNAAVEKEEGIENIDLKKMVACYTTANAAMKALGAHLDNLYRRENNPKLTDRLRNLKNVFKDKAQLSAARQAARVKFGLMEQLMESLQEDMQYAVKVVNQVRGHWV
jgi:hypothetical protein